MPTQQYTRCEHCTCSFTMGRRRGKNGSQNFHKIYVIKEGSMQVGGKTVTCATQKCKCKLIARRYWIESNEINFKEVIIDTAAAPQGYFDKQLAIDEGYLNAAGRSKEGWKIIVRCIKDPPVSQNISYEPFNKDEAELILAYEDGGTYQEL